MKKLTFAELEAKLADPRVPDREIRRYLKAVKGETTAFDPVVKPDPRTVEVDELDAIRVERLDFMGWANTWSRWRRQTRFEERFDNGDASPVLISEGDSWFQFPLLIDDTIDLLEPDHLIWSLDAAGDTLDNMLGEHSEYLETMHDPRFAGRLRGLLFSGGGNDIIGADAQGNSILAKVVKPFRAGKNAAWHIDTEECKAQLGKIETAYATMLAKVMDANPDLFVICHGYAHAVPAFTGDRRKPVWTKHGGWLRDPLLAKGFVDEAMQRAVVAALIDEFYVLLARICGGNHAGGRFANAWLVDARRVLQAGDWADEIHPTDAKARGFNEVATLFRAAIAEALAGGTPVG